MGTPPYKVTKEVKEKVLELKSFGITDEEIATYLEISVDTLTRYYKRELQTARIKANSGVANSLYRKAIGGDISAQIFWLKTQGRWRTEDNKSMLDSNEELKKELQELRSTLDKKNKKEY